MAKNNNGANLGFENRLWAAADKLRGQLFYTTQIPVCLWFVSRNKKNGRFHNRCGQTLFIDARKMGTLIDRVHRELSDEKISGIAGTYHAWRGEPITPPTLEKKWSG